MSGTTAGTGPTPPTITPPPITATTTTPPTTATTTATPSTTTGTTGTDTAAIPSGTGPETGAIGAGSDTTAAMPATAGTDDGAATPTPTAGADGTGTTGTPTGTPRGTTDTGTAAGTPATAGGATAAPVPADPFQAQVTRLYDMLLDRAPDTEGLAFWSNALRGGTALGAVADGFVATPEAQGRYAGLGDAEFVDALYRNALDREADPAGRDFWTGALQRGFDRGDIAQTISEASEHVSKLTLTFGGDAPLV
jgi:uncharacterized protein DUF4214